MFCTSLRRRKQWAAAAPLLLQHGKPRFRENKLDTHDVNMPLPSSRPGQRYLRFVLLSPDDEDSAYKQQRIERLYNLSGGRDAAVLWLLGEGGDASAFLQFQIEFMDKHDIPLVPLQNIAELPATLSKFHRALLQGDAFKRTAQDAGPGVLEVLLPYCSLYPPLNEHSINILSDLTVGFADIANKVSSEDGRAQILDYFGQEEAERIILFWMQEYLL
ncbi:hypothetical protein N0V93_001438 [Gnomoniopsis smithogilvyi]|uniref:Uncharacterized protein n=1 Tax=Gnomoniopsis smithogilvyi TaxID=1191159 RepID=A0A9W8Z5J0_9PEZI|nr:hypothetical protein N0V93_001438 [Gnomoniopsis smithogilvyi]